MGTVWILENLLDRISGNWYLQGVCSYSGVDLHFLVWMMRTLILRNRSEVTIYGHPLQCARCRQQMGTTLRGHPAQYVQVRRPPSLCDVREKR